MKVLLAVEDGDKDQLEQALEVCTTETEICSVNKSDLLEQSRKLKPDLVITAHDCIENSPALPRELKQLDPDLQLFSLIDQSSNSYLLDKVSLNYLDNLIVKPINQAQTSVQLEAALKTRAKTLTLQKEATSWRNLTDNMLDMVCQTDAAGNITYASPSHETILKYNPSDLINQPVFDFIHPDDINKVMAVFKKGIEDKAAGQAEYRFRHHDGHYIWVETTGTVMLDEQGSLSGVLFVSRDITNRKLLEEERARIFELSMDMIGSARHDGTITEINPACEKILGWSPEEFKTRPFFDYIHPDDLEPTRETVNAFQDNQPAIAFINRYRCKDGTYRWLSWNSSPDPEQDKIFFVARDITEAKKAEEKLEKAYAELEEKVKERTAELEKTVEKLQESEALLRESQEVGGIGSYVVGIESSTCISSETLSSILGIEHRDIHPMSVWEKAIHPDWRDDVMKIHKQSIASGSHFDEEYKIIRANDGEERWVRDKGKLAFDEQGSPTRQIGTIVDITDKKTAEEEIRAQRDRLHTLYSFSKSMRTVNNSAELYDHVLNESCRLLQADSCLISLLSADKKSYTITAGIGSFAPDVNRTFPVQKGLSGKAIRSEEPVTTDSYSSDNEALPLANAEQIGPVAVIPLRSEEGLIGILAAARKKNANKVPFVSSEVDALTAIGEIAGNTLRRQFLFDSARRRLEQVQALRNIDMAITGSLDLRVTFSVILDEITNLLKTDAAAIIRLEPQTGYLKYEAWRGFNYSNPTELNIRLGEGLAGRAAMERKSIQIPDINEVDSDQIQGLLLEKEGFAAYYAVPLIAKGHVQGVLEIYHREPFNSSGEWLEFLEALAGQTAIAIDNTELFHDMERTNFELIQAYDSTIEGWAYALDLKDEETEDHSRRVTKLTLNIARKMNIKEEELAHVKRGALLHDIGKMGVSDSILLKPGKLDDDEWEIMKQHPVYAHDMLSRIDYLRQALDIPYCHHEKWDGSGYPRGLKGKQIPLPARIFAVVDVYDALTSDRPYRDAWPEEKALKLIEEESGKHFDPEVVEIFLNEVGKTF